MPINVHASLLPRHRGAAPIEAAILAGDPSSGITIMRITEQMDAGPILLQRALALAPDETQGSLKDRLAVLGAVTLIEALDLLGQGKLVATPQDESRATYTSPITKEDGRIDWNIAAASIERMVRAYNPWPVARTSIGTEDLMFWRTRVLPTPRPSASSDQPPGTIVQLQPLPVIKCGSGMLELIEVQLAGRRRLSAADFARGRRWTVGMRLGI
jgi:methionyl-tRNA formyltransferase